MGVKGLAERKRQLVRDELGEAALRLLAWQGFEATTIDQIVASAGVSRRTFFRYFRSKEDVIVQFLGDVGDQLVGALRARPVTEPPAAALRSALSVLVDACLEHVEKTVRLTKLMLGTPALLARYLELQAKWRADLAAELASRAGIDPAASMHPALVSAVALDAFEVALRHWAQSDGEPDLSALVDQTLAPLAGVLNLVQP